MVRPSCCRTILLPAPTAFARSTRRTPTPTLSSVPLSQRLAAVIGTTFDSPPPDIDHPNAQDLWGLLKAGRRFRSLGSRDSYRLLRWLPMPIGDLMIEWFGNERLRALLAGPGLSGTMLGPRSAGSSLVFLFREACRLRAGGRSLRVRGGPGALTAAIAAAAREAGAEIRTGVSVERILVADERVTGVVAGGQEISCVTVLSGLDPRSTFLSLVDPGALAPEFATQIRNYRASGTVAKINLALSSLPAFRGVSDPSALAGRIHIGPELDYLERAFDCVKYGEVSTLPWLDITIPSIARHGTDAKGCPRCIDLHALRAIRASRRVSGRGKGHAPEQHPGNTRHLRARNSGPGRRCGGPHAGRATEGSSG